MKLTGSTHIAESADQLYDDLASAVITSAFAAIRSRGAFHLALSGGRTPEPFYMRLVIDPRYRVMPWSMTHVWQVDERRVPADDEQSNMKMIREVLVDHVSIRGRQVHAIDALADDAATRYEAALREVIAEEVVGQTKIPRLDFVLLGMGADGHTASLFPRSPALADRQRWIVTNDGPPEVPGGLAGARLTMTYPLLNAARKVVVLVTGQDKTETLRRVADHLRDHGPDAEALPITAVQPQPYGGELVWYLDSAAAGHADSALPEV